MTEVTALETKQAKAEREEREDIAKMVRRRRIIYEESIKAGWSKEDAKWLCYVHEQSE